MDPLHEEMKHLAQRAQNASIDLGLTSLEARNGALSAMAQILRDEADAIVAANEEDMAAAREKGTSDSLLDRLMLDRNRVFSMASALDDLRDLPDPLGRIIEQRRLPNGIDLKRISVPLGVVAIIYEARPNVTADAAGICLKSGNACILRGGSLAARSNEVIADLLAQAAESAGMPAGSIVAVTTTDRRATDELMGFREYIDVLIPRGGAGLIRHCVEHSKIPVIETGTGNCHVYVHKSADLAKALPIVVNAKTRRFGVCNAAESLLVDHEIAPRFLPQVLRELCEHQVLIHADESTAAIARSADIATVPATVEDWETEYLAPEIAVRCVDGLDQAIDHINTYGTKHSESIVAEEAEAIEEFLRRVDAAAVYANVSTAFTDGGQFGLGAEIGISTQKLHVRGPFALEGLTSSKYVLRGDGQVRP